MLSNLPVIRRSRRTHPYRCTSLLARQLLSLFLPFPPPLPPPVSFLLCRIGVSGPYFTGGEDLYNVRGYLPTSVQSLLFFYSIFFFCVSVLLFTYLPPRGSLCCSEWFASLISLKSPPTPCHPHTPSLSPVSLPLNHCVFCPPKGLGALFLPNSPTGSPPGPRSWQQTQSNGREARFRSADGTEGYRVPRFCKPRGGAELPLLPLSRKPLPHH